MNGSFWQDTVPLSEHARCTLAAERVESAARKGNVSMTLTVNGEAREAPKPRRNLLSYLRFDLGLTGSKYGCGEGLCGACTVLVDGQPLKSCMSNVGAVAG